MSTDDLTARVRDHLAHADTLPHGLAIALVSELADEVDRLRVDRDLTTFDLHVQTGRVDSARGGASIALTAFRIALHEARAERDAARAALERVRGVLDDYLGDHIANAHVVARDAIRALEGEPS